MIAFDAVPLLIFPCNGNALEATNCLGEAFRLVSFIDDTPEKQGVDRFGFPVRDRSGFTDWAQAQVLAVPGSPSSYRARRQIIEGLGIQESRFARVIHPSARISPHAVIGRNVLIMAGVVITSNAVIGDHVCVLPNSVIHHDAVVGAWSLVGSNVTLCGGSVIGENCYIGSGSTVMDGRRIGAGSLVGLGSNVIRNVPAGVTVAGNPARRVDGKARRPSPSLGEMEAINRI